jgi:hypothetical protein
MCIVTHSSMFQFIVLLFYNIVIIHVADLLIMFCFCNKYFLLMNICLIFVPYYLPKIQSCIIYKVHKGNNKITKLRTILQRESQNS